MSQPGDTSRFRMLRRWLRPGVGVNRWLLMMLVGLSILAAAGAMLIRFVFLEVPAHSPLGQIFRLIRLTFLPDPLRGILVLTIGVAIFG